MKEVEVSAKTVAEAIKLALEELGTSREEVEVHIISEGRHGILGVGAEEARVRVKLLKPTPSETGLEPGQESEIVSVTQGILEAMLIKMGVIASVMPQAGAPVTFDIEGENLGILIGRRGQTLASLQYIVRLMVAHQTKALVPIVIDVNGYKKRRYQALQALAWRMVEQVAASGKPFTLRPMPAYERRIIHLALVDHPDVTTQSIGVGEARRVVILPKGQSISATG